MAARRGRPSVEVELGQTVSARCFNARRAFLFADHLREKDWSLWAMTWPPAKIRQRHRLSWSR